MMSSIVRSGIYNPLRTTRNAIRYCTNVTDAKKKSKKKPPRINNKYKYKNLEIYNTQRTKIIATTINEICYYLVIIVFLYLLFR